MGASASLLAFSLAAPLALAAPADATKQEQLIRTTSAAELQNELLKIAQQQFAAEQLRPDAGSARWTLSGTAESMDAVWAAQPLWTSKEATTGPFAFGLQRFVEGRPSGMPMRATLSVKLLRDVWTAKRSVRRGSPLRCTDLTRRSLSTRALPADAWWQDCEMPMNLVSRRHLGEGDIVKATDLMPAPDVLADAAVLLIASTGPVAIEAKAIALADANRGETLRVRLERPRRMLWALVTAPGQVALLEDR